MKITCGLIGDHIGDSRFGVALAQVGAEHGVEVAFEHIDTAERHRFDFDGTILQLRKEGWTGVTVTHPWKLDAMALADLKCGVPERLLSSNLLRFGHGIEASNTDYTGFRNMWAEAGLGAPGRVAMAGAGGVARSIAAALDTLGAEDIAVWDMRAGAAEALAKEIGGTVRAVLPMDAPAVVGAATGVVNATPLGMAAHPGTAFAALGLGPQSWAFDAVYAPAPTVFATDAAAAGLALLSGHDLFRYMLLGSFKVYTGIEPDAVAMLPVLRALMEDGW
ncbi:MAG: hypothetical protein AAF367_15900 [Pseudomonadota bacterium]